MAASARTQTVTKTPSFTEEAVLIVRRDLLRLGCRRNEISVMQGENSLKFVYGDEELIANPIEVHATLRSMRRPVQVDDIWVILCIHHKKW